MAAHRQHTAAPVPAKIQIDTHVPPAHPQAGTDCYAPPRALHPALRVLIVGAGIAGLSTALALLQAGFAPSAITLYESACSVHTEVGAGLQLAPNFTRCLARFGILDDMRPYAVALEANSLRRYSDNALLGSAPLMPDIETRFGSPLWVAHRADLQRLLLARVHTAGVHIACDKRVAKVDLDAARPRVWFADGTCATGDVVLAADGVKSAVRAQMLARHGVADQARATGDSAYRLTIPRAKLLPHPELLALLDSRTAYRWMGPSGHIMVYAIRGHQILNMVLAHPDATCGTTVESWTAHGSKSEMRATYAGWNAVVRALLEFAEEDEVLEWKLMDHVPLPTWVEGSVALLGDACHPMLPYVAQGAAQAVEDACVLAAVLSGVEPPGTSPSTSATNGNGNGNGAHAEDASEMARSVSSSSSGSERVSNGKVNGNGYPVSNGTNGKVSRDDEMGDGEVARQVRRALALYTRVRKERAERIQASAVQTRGALHLHDGPMQKERDAAISQATSPTSPTARASNPDKWADAAWQAYMYGTDTTAEALALLHRVREDGDL